MFRRQSAAVILSWGHVTWVAVISVIGWFTPEQLVAQVPGTLQIVGNYSYSIDFNSETVDLNVEKIVNASQNYTSGTLQLSLWATDVPYSGGSISGYQVAKYRLDGSTNGQLPPNSYFSSISATVPIDSRPPAGGYYATLILSEYSTACTSPDSFCVVDYGSFSSPMNVPAKPVTVIPTLAAGSGGGGGSMAPWFICLLVLLRLFKTKSDDSEALGIERPIPY